MRGAGGVVAGEGVSVLTLILLAGGARCNSMYGEPEAELTALRLHTHSFDTIPVTLEAHV